MSTNPSYREPNTNNPFRDPSRVATQQQQQQQQQQYSSSSSTGIPQGRGQEQGYPSSAEGLAPPLPSFQQPSQQSSIRIVGHQHTSSEQPLISKSSSSPSFSGGGGILKPSRSGGFVSEGSDVSSQSYNDNNNNNTINSNGMTTPAGGGTGMSGGGGDSTPYDRLVSAASGNGNTDGRNKMAKSSTISSLGSAGGVGSGHKSSLSYAAPPKSATIPSTSSTTSSTTLLPPTTSSSNPNRPRRSLSSSSIDSPPIASTYNNNNNYNPSSTLKQPNIIPVAEKLKSRHADIIDKWDGSGIGRGMLHHSGPYDAAAPSRNSDTKAPMKAFSNVAGGGGGDLPPPNSAPPHHRGYSNEKLSDETPGIDEIVPVLSSTHLDQSQGYGNQSKHSNNNNKPSRHLSQRAQAALRSNPNAPISPNRNTIGSLQGQYSTSLPSSGGGWFPNNPSFNQPNPPNSNGHGHGQSHNPTRDSSGSSNEGLGSGGGGAGVGGGPSGLGTVGEGEMMGGGMRLGESGGGFGEERRYRERDREQKRRALKAAWGIDEPEPYEQFGYTGGLKTDEPVQLHDQPFPSPTKVRSPGLRLGLSSSSSNNRNNNDGNPSSRGNTPTENESGQNNAEYFGLKSGNSTGSTGSGAESPGIGGAGLGNNNGKGAGLKRTKSLMQRLRAMRENPNMPPGDNEGRSASPTGPYNEDTLGIRDDSAPAMNNISNNNNNNRPRRNSWLRRMPSSGNPSNLPGSPEAQEEVLDDDVDDSKAISGGTGGGFQILESPNSKSKSRSRSHGRDFAVAGGGGGDKRQRSSTLNDKALPPPPVGQVMPEFENQWQGDGVVGGGGSGSGSGSGPERRGSGGIGGGGSGGAGVQRKTSIMKKVKDKIGGR